MEQGSYLLLEPGMTVRGTDGDLGTVAEVIADEGADIFRGITLSSGLFSTPVFVPEDRLTSVVDDTVTVNLSRDEARHLRSAGS
jgi:uncharacterized protein YrrD